MATMVNMNSLLNGKDSRWLQLEVCREFQRNKCSRPDTECKFAHPPATVEVQNGRVTACYDSIKGRCNREKPPCKYFHPPQHLKDQLLINGRNHLALKNALMQQMGLTPGQVLPGQVPAVVGGVSGAGAAASHLAALDPISLALLAPQATSPYLSGVPGVGSTYAQYYAPQLVPAVLGHDPAAAAASPLGVMQQPVLQQKLPRTDRLETAAASQQPAASATSEPGKKRPAPAELEPPPMDMKSVGSFYYDNFAFPGVVPYKRPAVDKAGVPVYQPATTYQQLMQLQQPFVPVSCCAPPNAPYVEYTDERGQVTSAACRTLAPDANTLYTSDFYWTPSRCAKILIDKDVRDPPADSFIFVKGAGCRWWGAAWWCAATPPPARAAAPPAATTTSPCSCRPRCALPNTPSPRTRPPPRPPPHPLPHRTSPAPLVIHIDRASDTLGKGRFLSAGTVAPAAEVMIF